MTLQSWHKTSNNNTQSDATTDDNVSHRPQDGQAQEPQEEHMPTQPHPSYQRPDAPYTQQFQHPDGRQLILQFFHSMVQSQEQYTKNLRKGTEGIREIAPAQNQEIPTCNYCHRRGHMEKNCYRKLGLCLGCGSNQHQHKSCPERHSTTPTIHKHVLPAQGGPMRRPQTQQQQKVTPYQIHDISICKFCKRRGHIKENCRLRLGQCMSCGSNKHQVKECLKKPGTRRITKTGERSAIQEHKIPQPEDRVHYDK